jgi:hypothetical protein
MLIWRLLALGLRYQPRSLLVVVGLECGGGQSGAGLSLLRDLCSLGKQKLDLTTSSKLNLQPLFFFHKQCSDSFQDQRNSSRESENPAQTTLSFYERNSYNVAYGIPFFVTKHMPKSLLSQQRFHFIYVCVYVCNPASTIDNLCPKVGGGVPTRAGRLRIATLLSRPDIATTGRLPTLTFVAASK